MMLCSFPKQNMTVMSKNESVGAVFINTGSNLGDYWNCLCQYALLKLEDICFISGCPFYLQLD